MQKLLLVGFFMSSAVLLTACSSNSTDTQKETWKCKDVTSYDRNWNNDMKCTSSNGRVQYTSYEGARMLKDL